MVGSRSFQKVTRFSTCRALARPSSRRSEAWVPARSKGFATKLHCNEGRIRASCCSDALNFLSLPYTGKLPIPAQRSVALSLRSLQRGPKVNVVVSKRGFRVLCTQAYADLSAQMVQFRLKTLLLPLLQAGRPTVLVAARLQNSGQCDAAGHLNPCPPDSLTDEPAVSFIKRTTRRATARRSGSMG